MKEETRKCKWWELLDEEQYQTTFRMSNKSATALQIELEYLEGKENILTSIDDELLIMLWFLGNTQPISDASELFNIHEDKEVKDALKRITILGQMYIGWPTENETDEIQNTFMAKYGLSSIVGALGSLYLSVTDPEDREEYYNQQTNQHMIVLQAVCDCNLLFRDVCVGCPGSYTATEILKNSPLYSKLTSRDSFIFNSGKYLLGGTQHPELKTLLTPYKGKNLTKEQYEFNTLHSSIISIVEEAFECLRNRFPRLAILDSLDPEFASLIVAAACILHNFTRIRNDSCEFNV